MQIIIITVNFEPFPGGVGKGADLFPCSPGKYAFVTLFLYNKMAYSPNLFCLIPLFPEAKVLCSTFPKNTPHFPKFAFIHRIVEIMDYLHDHIQLKPSLGTYHFNLQEALVISPEPVKLELRDETPSATKR